MPSSTERGTATGTTTRSRCAPEQHTAAHFWCAVPSLDSKWTSLSPCDLGCDVARAAAQARSGLAQVLNPATGKPTARLVKSGADATNRAIDAAAAALPAWQATMAAERAAVLERWHDALAARKEDIAATMTEECGKPLKEAHGEVASGLASVRWFAAEAERCGPNCGGSRLASCRACCRNTAIAITLSIAN